MTTSAFAKAAAPAFAGIYDVPEAARYLKASAHGDLAYPVSSATLLRWVRKGMAAPELSGVSGSELLIAFEDLVSLRIVAALRGAGVGWSDIRRAEKWLREQTSATRPFATEYLWTGEGQIFVDWTQRLISVSRNGQLAFDVLKDYLIPVHGLSFDRESRLAKSWEPAAGVVLEPEVQFGSPCIKGTRIPTRAISDLIEAGESLEWVAKTYQLTVKEAQAAHDWESRLRAA